MAGVASATHRYDNFDRSTIERHDRPESSFTCDCGQVNIDEARLKQHQQTDCKNRSLKCSFCPEKFVSSGTLRGHLLSCGNKTDRCPTCQRLIRRSHFTYHYENNCAPVDKVETPPSRPRNAFAQRIPVNFNKPVAREDVPNNDHSNNYPVNQYRRQPPPSVPSRANPKQEHSNGIVHVPCEFCNQPIDLPNWSKHTQNCREREEKRVADRARLISQEPITEPLPCEHCQRLYAANRLSEHQENCPQNPRRGSSVGRYPGGSRFSRSASLPRRLNHDRGHSPPLTVRSKPAPRHVHYDVVDVDRTHEANRSRLRRSASDDQILLMPHSPGRSAAYDNQSMRSNERYRDDTTSRLDGTPQRIKSPSNFTGRNDNRDSRKNPSSERSTHRDHRGSHKYVVIDNSSNSPLPRKNKSSCGPVHEPIPAHPDALYRPQHRPTPPPVVAVAPNVMNRNFIAPAPLAAGAGGGGLSPWWILGPLLAVLVAMAVGTLSYTMKKKSVGEENDPEKKKTKDEKGRKVNEENPEGDRSAKRLPVTNGPLGSMQPETFLDEQKRTVPMTSKTKDNSTSHKESSLLKSIPKNTASESVSPTHRSPPAKDAGASLSNRPDSTKHPQQVVPINVTRAGKPLHNTPMDPSLMASLNNIRSGSTPGTESETILNKKGDKPDNKSVSGQNLPNIDRADHTEPKRFEQNNLSPPLARHAMNNLSTPNKSDGSQTKQPISSEENEVKASPLMSNDPTKEGKKFTSSNPNLQTKGYNQFQGLKNPRSTSDGNKDEEQSISSARSKHDALSDQHLLEDKNDLTKSGVHPTDSSTSSKDPSQSHLTPFTVSPRKTPDEGRSDESNTSITTLQKSTNPDKSQTKMPHVPICKGDPSSDDDDYDDMYSISANDVKNQPTPSKHSMAKKLNSNSNKNVSTFRKKRRLNVHRSLTKSFHSKDEKI